jgi:hypothetical protein
MSGGVIGGDTEADANKAGVGGNVSAYYFGGGGVLVTDGARFTMTENALIKGNVSGRFGGGVLAYNGVFRMLGGVITANKAANEKDGGGVYRNDGDDVVVSIEGDPWVGPSKSSGAGPGWIHGNFPYDIVN